MSVQKYLGTLETEKNVPEMLTLASQSCCIPLHFIFWDKYSCYPCSLNIYLDESKYAKYENLQNILKEDFNHDTINDVIDYQYDNKSSYVYASSQTSDFGNGAIVTFSFTYFEEPLQTAEIDDMCKNNEQNRHLLTAIKAFFKPASKPFVEKLIEKLVVSKSILKEATLQMICKDRYALYLTEIKIKKPCITDLKLHYGDGFNAIHEKIIKVLKEPNSTGIVLLHGLPGTGKTHYIRYLIQEINEKKLIYIPPDMTSCIATPEFFPFMLQHKDSILIIEDAENIIKSRDESNNSTQAVANLLNLSDGLLGDSLRQPIIATFNCELNNIDPALLRKGRLIAQHQFGKLDVKNAQKLSDSLGFETHITEPMALAEIYGQEN